MDGLKRKAEGIAQAQASAVPEPIDALSPDDTRKLLHELQVHQIELEMQNEQLRHAQAETDAARARYFDLYDLAPVGYCTVSENGLILEANLTATSMLGVGRNALIKQPFSRFLVSEHADSFYLHRKRLLETGEPLACELQMMTSHRKPFWVHVAAKVVRKEEGETTLRVVLSDISRLKNAESALQKSEAFNRAILDSLDAEVAVIDRDGTIVAINQAWRRFALDNKKPSGSVEHLVRAGVNYLAVCAAAGDDDQENAIEARMARDGIQGVLDGHLPRFTLEYSCHSPEQERWFSMNVTPLGDGAVISHTNITHVKQLEEAAKASSLYLRSLFEAILDPLVTIDADGKISDANTASETITGISREAMIGTDYADYFTNPEEVRAGYQQVIEQGYLTDYPLSIRHVSGKITDVLGSASLYRDSSGKILGVFATAHDITERKRALEKLHDQKEFFHLIAENISDFIAVLDAEGRRIYTSPSYKLLFGANRNLQETDAFSEVHPDDRERIKTIFKEAVKTGHSPELEYRLVIADGSVRTMESRSSIIRDCQEKVARVVVVSHDITERKLMEYQIHQMAFHDTLTRLPNRRMLNDRLGQAMAASARSGLYVTVMFIDLDNFKPLNDKHGHDIGDLLLIQVAERLKGCVRGMDTVARFGGDEFVVMIRELATERAESVIEAGIIAEKIRLCLAEPFHLTVKKIGMPEEIIEHRCTASIGVVVFYNHEASQDAILKCADAAMYQAKESGRNSVRFIEMGPDCAIRSVPGVGD